MRGRREFLKLVGIGAVAVAMPASLMAAAEAMAAPVVSTDYAAWLKDKIEAHVAARGFDVIRPEPPLGEELMLSLMPPPAAPPVATRVYVPLRYVSMVPDGDEAEWGQAATFWVCFREDYDASPGDLYWRQTPSVVREKDFEEDIVYVQMYMRCAVRREG